MGQIVGQYIMDFHGVKAKEKPAWQRAFWMILDVHKKDNGGAKGIRTPDLLNAIQALSQLSYSPTQNREIICKMQKSVKDIFVAPTRRLRQGYQGLNDHRLKAGGLYCD